MFHQEMEVTLIQGETISPNRRAFRGSPEGEALSLAHTILQEVAEKHGFSTRLKMSGDTFEDKKEDYQVYPVVRYSIDVKPKAGGEEPVHKRLAKLSKGLSNTLAFYDSVYGEEMLPPLDPVVENHVRQAIEVIQTELVVGDL